MEKKPRSRKLQIHQPIKQYPNVADGDSYLVELYVQLQEEKEKIEDARRHDATKSLPTIDSLLISKK